VTEFDGEGNDLKGDYTKATEFKTIKKDDGEGEQSHGAKGATHPVKVEVKKKVAELKYIKKRTMAMENDLMGDSWGVEVKVYKKRKIVE
jgi:hypothetical protein